MWKDFAQSIVAATLAGSILAIPSTEASQPQVNATAIFWRSAARPAYLEKDVNAGPAGKPDNDIRDPKPTVTQADGPTLKAVPPNAPVLPNYSPWETMVKPALETVVRLVRLLSEFDPHRLVVDKLITQVNEVPEVLTRPNAEIEARLTHDRRCDMALRDHGIVARAILPRLRECSSVIRAQPSEPVTISNDMCVVELVDGSLNGSAGGDNRH
jgi:hypothetical protein